MSLQTHQSSNRRNQVIAQASVDTSRGALYTHAASDPAVDVTEILLANSSTQTTVQISLAIAGATHDDNQSLIPSGFVIAANDTVSLKVGGDSGIRLSADDIIRGIAGQAGVSCTLIGRK
jgi:hypothetical protein